MEPIKKTPLRTVSVILALPLFVAMLMFGGAGMAYFLDSEGAGPFRKSPEFSRVMETLNSINMAFTPLFFNVGLVGTIFVFIYFTAPNATEGKKDSKKDQ